MGNPLLVIILSTIYAVCGFYGGHESCLDIGRREGGINAKNGFYFIGNPQRTVVYCDFTSEKGAAWTLVSSFSFGNRDIPAFSGISFTTDAPVNEKSPNFVAYRLPYLLMEHLRRISTHWRTTSNFETKSDLDYIDYMRANFEDFDFMVHDGNGTRCMQMEFMNFGGRSITHGTAPFEFKQGEMFNLKISQPYSDTDQTCQFGQNFFIPPGGVSHQFWFGGYM